MSRLPLLLSLALAPCTVSCASNEYGFDSEIHGQTGLHFGMQLASGWSLDERVSDTVFENDLDETTSFKVGLEHFYSDDFSAIFMVRSHDAEIEGNSALEDNFLEIDLGARWYWWETNPLQFFLQGELAWVTDVDFNAVGEEQFGVGLGAGLAWWFMEEIGLEVSGRYLYASTADGYRNDDPKSRLSGFEIEAALSIWL